MDTDPQQIIDEANLEAIRFWEPGEKTMVVFARLPNGYEITESAHALDPDAHDPDTARRVLARKLAVRIMELTAYAGEQSGGGE